jgi:hypothetical protein
MRLWFFGKRYCLSLVKEVGVHLEDSRMVLRKKKWHLTMKDLKDFTI